MRSLGLSFVSFQGSVENEGKVGMRHDWQEKRRRGIVSDQSNDWYEGRIDK
jgi:hypothetical protein